jgi:hypothetical protein
MSLVSHTTSTKTAPMVGKLPPLENGDQLTRPEFERRYEAMPHRRSRLRAFPCTL